MRADRIDIGELSPADEAALAQLKSQQSAMEERVVMWSKINTGSWNAEGLNTFAPILAEAFAETEAKVELLDTQPIEQIDNQAKINGFQSGPVIRATARLDAPIQIIMTGHYDTVFPAGTFEWIKDIGDGKLNGPGLADMKGGITVMLEAIKAFEAGPYKDALGYTVILSPDEETGNFASAPFIKEAAEKAHVGLTFEPAMEDGSLAGARKGSAVYDIIFHGKSVHAGREPENGRSAIWAACEFSLLIEALNGQMDGVTFNVGSVDGGAAVNIVPDLAIVRMGVRAPDGASADWADASVRAAFDKACSRPDIHGHIHGGFYRPPKPRNAAQDKLIEDVKATGRALGLELNFKDTGGVCEGNNVFAAGTPNIDTLGVRGGRIHSSEEFLIVESLSERAGLAALILNRIADGRIDARKLKDMMQDD